jgi:hypothetical protein
VLLSTPLPAYISPHLLNVLIQIANKLGFKKKICSLSERERKFEQGQNCVITIQARYQRQSCYGSSVETYRKINLNKDSNTSNTLR